MRKWWNTLGLTAATLGICVTSASAQFGPPGGGMPPGMMGGPPGMMGGPPGMMGGPPGMMGGPPGMMGGGGPPPGMLTGGAPPGALMGAFSNGAPPGAPADFPNAAGPSEEPVSPFTIRDEGMPNAFTEMHAPRCRTDPYALVIRSEYLGWRISNGPIAQPIVTTTANPSFNSFGQLGDSGTVILLDRGNTVDYNWANGVRFTVGAAIGYIPPVEFTGMYLKRSVTVFSGGSLNNPTQLLAIPFQDVQPGFVIPGTAGVGTESAIVVSVPVGNPVGALGGTISVRSDITISGFEGNMFFALNDADTFRLDFFAGYRHLHMSENLNISTQVGGSAGGVLFNGFAQPGNIFTSTTNDFFGTTNDFDGGQFGFRGVLDMGRWAIFSDIKLGLGSTTEKLSIAGTSTLSQTLPNRPSQTVNGGILALPSNSVNLTVRKFSVVPEATLSLSFQCTNWLRFFGGYDIMYWTNVARPGDAINTTIDSRQIPTAANFTAGVPYNGPAAPTSIQQRNLLANGVFFGIEIGF